MDRNRKNEQQNEPNNQYQFQNRFYNSKLDKQEPQQQPYTQNQYTNQDNTSIPPKHQKPNELICQKRIWNTNTNIIESDWNNRYNRAGYIKPSILAEDEELFKEHLETLKQKEQFNFDKLEKEELIHIYFNDNELTEENHSKVISETGLDQRVKSNLKKMSYELLTPIQRCIIPYVLKRRDCLGCAQTGSGKTIAFLAPIVSLMLQEGYSRGEMKNYYCSYPICMILVPTRELAEQIYKEVRKVIHQTGIVAVKLYGGVPNDTQIRELKAGCDIVIGTPGRVIEHIEKKFLYLNLIKYLVIDESDRMLDMGFEDQMNAIILNSQMPDKSKRSNLMFSATIPHGVLSISQKYMNEAYLLSSSSQNETGNANSNVEQIIHYVNDEDKIAKLHEIFQQIKGNAIIFLQTKKSVDKLENFLERRNYSVCAIHGDKPQAQRQEVIQLFSSGEIPILIATDVVSRGLDFPNVAYVFNFDMPKNIEDYIHRIGRTGRVGNKGTAISFFNDSNASIAKDLFNVLSKMNQTIPDWLYDYCNSSNSYYREKRGYGGGGNRGYQKNNYNNRNYYDNSYSHSNKGNYYEMSNSNSNQNRDEYENENDNNYNYDDQGGKYNKYHNSNSNSNYNQNNSNSNHYNNTKPYQGNNHRPYNNYNNNNRNDYNNKSNSAYNNNNPQKEVDSNSNQKDPPALMFYNSKKTTNEPKFKDLNENNQSNRGGGYYK